MHQQGCSFVSIRCPLTEAHAHASCDSEQLAAFEDIAGKTRNVPEGCELLTVARRMGVSLG